MEQWQWFPKDLPDKQLNNPYLVFKKVFKSGSLEFFRKDLEEWLQYGLNKEPIDDGILNLTIATVFEGLQKLYSAAWLIWQVEGDRPFLKKEIIADEAISSDSIRSNEQLSNENNV
jgi:hypothetical protein